MDGGRLDTGVAKGSLSRELAVVAVVSAVLGRTTRGLSSEGCPAM